MDHRFDSTGEAAGSVEPREVRQQNQSKRKERIMKQCVVMLAVVLVAGVAVAQNTMEDLRNELRSVDRRIAVARNTAMRAPATAAKRVAARKANEEYRAAVGRLADVEAITDQITALQKQLRTLETRRREIVESNKERLAAKRAACDAANRELREAMEGGTNGRALMESRRELIRRMEQKRGAQRQ